MYFENIWKCVDNYVIVDFSRFDVSSRRFFCVMKDESYFNIKYEDFGWKGEVGR